MGLYLNNRSIEYSENYRVSAWMEAFYRMHQSIIGELQIPAGGDCLGSIVATVSYYPGQPVQRKNSRDLLYV